MTPFYFGTSRKPLFGIYDPPDSRRDLGRGAVLCHSLGREQILSHRTFRRLATQLSRAGFHVLRFDYYGCGDSSGSDQDSDLVQWAEDVSAAVEELRDYGGLQRTSIVGLRLGASLAAQLANESTDLEQVVLWEPIVSGSEYVRELLALQRTWLRDEDAPTDVPSTDGSFEVLGFRVSAAMRRDLEALDLLITPRLSAERALIIEQSDKAATKQLHGAMATAGVIADYQCVEAPRFWIKGELNKAQVPIPVVESIVSWMAQNSA